MISELTVVQGMLLEITKCHLPTELLENQSHIFLVMVILEFLLVMLS
jgi:hypothetical protein